MSHFAVTVISEHADDVEGLLAPYQEYNGGDMSPEYLVWDDSGHDKYVEEYNDPTNTTEVRRNIKDGSLKSKYDDQFRDPNSFGISSSTKWLCPPGYEADEVPLNKLYPTFEQFMKEWHGYGEREKRNGRYGHLHNPNSRWDWWEIGGRYSGLFQVKQGREAQTLVSCASIQTADQLYLGAIDWDAMRNQAEQKAHAEFDRLESAIVGVEIGDSWTEIRNRYPDDIDKARSVYRAQPIVQAARQIGDWGCPIDKYFLKDGGRQAYVNHEVESIGVTFAMITPDGDWHEKGKAGWFGTSTGDMDTNQWNKRYHQLLSDCRDTDVVTLVDCHI